MASPGAGVFDLAVIGERYGGHEPQEAIGPAVDHAAARLGVTAPTVRWVGTDDLARDGAVRHLGGADAIWCAPGSPYRSFEGALEGIRFAREQRVPFLGTCAGFQHAVIEVARHVAGLPAADHEEYGREGGDLLIHELLCSLAGQRLDVRLVDAEVAARYGADRVEERYYCSFGLNPVHLPRLEAAGLVVAGVDVADGQPRIMRLADHPFFLVTLFVPQTSSRAGAPHPLVTALVSELAARSVGAAGPP